MAEKKLSAPAPTPDTLFRDVSIVVGIALFIYVGNNITPLTADTISSGEAPSAILSFLLGYVPFETMQNFIFSLKSALAVLGVLFLAGSFWATLKIWEVHHVIHEKYSPIHLDETLAREKLSQWQVVLDHVNSESPAEWKIAILEADDILDQILEDLGFTGETVAEKLKSMSRTKIASYDDLWEAHKVRNEIAHGGAIEMDLSKKMARDTIAKFGNAFKELGYL